MKRRTCSKSWKRSSHCASCDKSNARTSFICTRTAQHNTRSLVGALADRPTDYAMLCSKCSPPLNCAARRCAREPLACCPLYTLCARRVLRRSPETRRADAAAPRVRRRGGLVRGGRCGDSLCAFASSIAPPLNKCPQLNSSQLSHLNSTGRRLCTAAQSARCAALVSTRLVCRLTAAERSICSVVWRAAHSSEARVTDDKQ